MQCFMKKEDKRLIDVERVETTYFDNCAFFDALSSLNFCYSFASSISVLLLSHCAQLTSPSPLVIHCAMANPVAVIRLNIVTIGARILKFVL